MRFLFREFIKFPANIQNTQAEFYQIANVPFVAGCVDGTDIKIDAPIVHEEAYVDRHSNHSMNLTTVCGPRMEFF
jgi:hypothetical protein